MFYRRWLIEIFGHAIALSLLLTLTEVAVPHFSARYFDLTIQDPAEGFYSSLTGIGAQVGAVLLALYFTTIGVVTSGVYVNVPEGVRARFLQDPTSRKYIHLVSMFTLTSWTLMGLQPLGYTGNWATVSVLTFAGVFAVVSFVSLGIRAFTFFEPTLLGEPTFSRLRSLVGTTPYSTRTRLFTRNHAVTRVHTERQLQILRDVAVVATTRERPDLDRLEALGSQLLTTLGQYARVKNLISSHSGWFEPEQRYRSWLAAPFEHVISFRNGSGNLDPYPVPNDLWFEQEALEIYSDLVKCLVRQEGYFQLTSLIKEAKTAVHEFSSRLLVDEALLISELTCQLVFAVDTQFDLNDKNQLDSRELSLLEITRRAAELYCVIAAGAREGFEEFPFFKIKDDIPRSLHFSVDRDLYDANIPRCITKRIEELKSQCLLEISAEGSIVTPQWYFSQQLSLATREALGQVFGTTISRTCQQLDHIARRVGDGDASFNALPLLLARITVAPRLRYLTGLFRAALSSLELERPFTSYTDVSRDSLILHNNRLRTFERLSATSIASSSSLLKQLPIDPRTPDYFGLLYDQLGEAVVDALLYGDERRFKDLYSAFFELAWQAPIRMHRYSFQAGNDILSMVAEDAIVDLMDVSGYAIVLVETCDNLLWEHAKAKWDNKLAAADDERVMIEELIRIGDPETPRMVGWPRDMIRKEWYLKVLGNIEELGLDIDHTRRYFGYGAFGASSGVLPFICRYLLQRPAAKGLGVSESLDFRCSRMDAASDDKEAVE